MYRIAFVIGTLLGLGEAARRLDAAGAEPAPAVAATPLPAAPPRRFSLVPSGCRGPGADSGLPVPSSLRRAVRDAIGSHGSCPSSCCRSRSRFFIWLFLAGARSSASDAVRERHSARPT